MSGLEHARVTALYTLHELATTMSTLQIVTVLVYNSYI